MVIRNGSKQTILTNGGLEPLQMVLELDTGHQRGERNITYMGLEISPYYKHFKTLRGSPKEKVERGQYFLTEELGCYKIL